MGGEDDGDIKINKIKFVKMKVSLPSSGKNIKEKKFFRNLVQNT